MDANWVIAISTAVLAVATVALVIVATVQLGGLKEQLRQSAEQELRRNTLEAIQRSESDPILQVAYEKISSVEGRGSDFTGTSTCKLHVTNILNCYEAIAIGIAQEVYLDQMVRDYLQVEIKLAVDIWLIGESTDALKAPQRMFKSSEYTELQRLYKRWFPEAATKYRAG